MKKNNIILFIVAMLPSIILITMKLSGFYLHHPINNGFIQIAWLIIWGLLWWIRSDLSVHRTQQIQIGIIVSLGIILSWLYVQKEIGGSMQETTQRIISSSVDQNGIGQIEYYCSPITVYTESIPGNLFVPTQGKLSTYRDTSIPFIKTRRNIKEFLTSQEKCAVNTESEEEFNQIRDALQNGVLLEFQ